MYLNELERYTKTVANKIGTSTMFFGLTVYLLFNLYDHFWQLIIIPPVIGMLAREVAYLVIYERNFRQPPDDDGDYDDEPTQPPETEGDNKNYHLWAGGFFRTGKGGNMVPIPDTVAAGHLVAIDKARADGRLPTVSANKLDSLKIASRNTEPPNADSVIKFLEGVGVIKSTGNRKPYEWTETAVVAFPSPTPPNRPNSVAYQSRHDSTRPHATAATGGAR